MPCRKKGKFLLCAVIVQGPRGTPGPISAGVGQCCARGGSQDWELSVPKGAAPVTQASVANDSFQMYSTVRIGEDTSGP